MKTVKLIIGIFMVTISLLVLGNQVIGQEQDSDESQTITIPMTQILNNDQAAIELLTRNGVPAQLISEIQTNYTPVTEGSLDGGFTTLGVQSDKYTVCPNYEWGNALYLHGGPSTASWKFSDGFSLGNFFYCTDLLGCLTFHQARRGPGVSPTQHTVVADWISSHTAWCS
jgi:hypothetical protein